MALVDATHIQSLTRQLDEAVPREGHVEVIPDRNDFDYKHVRANQLGYLRLGIEFLKAAYASPEHPGKDQLLKLDLAYLEGFDHESYSFERREDVWSPMWPEEEASAIPQLVGWLFALLLIAPFVVGVVTIFRWLVNTLV